MGFGHWDYHNKAFLFPPDLLICLAILHVITSKGNGTTLPPLSSKKAGLSSCECAEVARQEETETDTHSSDCKAYSRLTDRVSGPARKPPRTPLPLPQMLVSNQQAVNTECPNQLRVHSHFIIVHSHCHHVGHTPPSIDPVVLEACQSCP